MLSHSSKNSTASWIAASRKMNLHSLVGATRGPHRIREGIRMPSLVVLCWSEMNTVTLLLVSDACYQCSINTVTADTFYK